MDTIRPLNICLIGVGNIGKLHYAHLMHNTNHNIYLYDEVKVNLQMEHQSPLRPDGRSHNVCGKDIPPNMDVYWVSVDLDTNKPEPFYALMERVTQRISDSLVNSHLICSTSTIVGDGYVFRERLKKHSHYIYLPERFNSNHDLETNLGKRRYVGIERSDIYTSMELLRRMAIHVDARCIVSIRTAEFMKHVENTKRALDVVWHNDVINAAVNDGVDASEFKQLNAILSTDKPINPEPIRASVGYGGQCLANSVAQVARRSSSHLIRNIERANNFHIADSIENIKSAWLSSRESHAGTPVRLVLYGVAYKPNGTHHCSPALAIIHELMNWCEGVGLYVCDPTLDYSVAATHRLLMHRMLTLNEARDDMVASCHVKLVASREFDGLPFDLSLAD